MLKPDNPEFREIIIDEVQKAFNIQGFHEVKMIPFTHGEHTGREWGMKFEIIVPISDEVESENNSVESIMNLIFPDSTPYAKVKFARYELVVGFYDNCWPIDKIKGDVSEADSYKESFVYFNFIPIIRGNIMDVIKGVNRHFKQTSDTNLSYSIDFEYTEHPHYVHASYDDPDEQYTQYLLSSDEVSDEIKDALRISLKHAPIFAKFVDNLAEYLSIASNQ